MQGKTDRTFNDLVEQYLGKQLPDEMAASFSMSTISVEAQDFVVRMLSLMKRSGYSLTDFNPHLIHWLSVTIPSTLPGAWGGQIPPLTLPRRHRKLDNYVANRSTSSTGKPPLFIDVGCGFPPVTSADTAKRLPDWHVCGIDRSFADYVLYDVDGHYACFDRKGKFLYFQAFMNASGRALYADPKATRDRFNTLFEDLFPLLKNADSSASESVEKDGNRLIHNHIRDFETANLSLVKSDLTELDLPPAKVVRCMNVLIYYKPETKKQMLKQAGDLLDDDGVLIAGTNGLGVQSRYAVYRKNKDELFMDEFAFGLDNVGHIVFMPFFTIHDNDQEAMLLADLTAAIRSDESFWPEFSRRQDELFEQYGICQRRPDGFLGFLTEGMPLKEYLKINAQIWNTIIEEGYVDRAVDVLGQAGFEAWTNAVGDIAIRPSVDTNNW